ncbi:HAD-IIB family hydrolase [Sulfuricella sp.]|uniref:HAD-IIB family hydrolase n=1 Tax=Sulfuricella sp. TaxID=2099377 RepID=UPI002C629D6E|nr:HAD-IIB family hydrolase [Sulfuricella sp.]HUX62382.1 HAD-IIB family hydrolase [Sulfuricella sp.]
MRKTILFSDLDGTLLDAVRYSFNDALPALSLIQAHGVPLVLCSSKTRAEIVACRQRMHNFHPFITENGGGIFIPQGYFSALVDSVDGYQRITLGTPYAEIRRHFVALRERLGASVRGFADMTAEEVAELTGLSCDDAVLSKQRDFDEPFVFDGAPDARFLQAIEDAGLHWTQGRVFHIMGKHDKGLAVKTLKALYEREYGEIFSIGLGDSLNDLPLLQAVDRPVLIRHEDGSFDSRIAIAGLMKTQSPGPQGWNEAVLQLLAGDGEEETPASMLTHIFSAALAAVDPFQAVLNAAKLENDRLTVAGAAYPLDDFSRIVVVGAGKGTARMALAMEVLLGERISAGLIIVKEGHAASLDRVGQVEASHPVPNEAGVEGAQRIFEMVRTADEKTLVICLLSGGASALLVAPVAKVTLQDKQQVTALLLKAGATIGELNAVRKHLSAVKGGRLAQAAYPAQMVTMILSDVIGDRLDVIASGPTAPDESSFDDAWAVIEKYGLKGKIAERVMSYLQRGIAGQEPETVKAGDPCLLGTRNVIVGGIGRALAAAQAKSRQLGLGAKIVTAELQGEARDAARFLALTARRAQAGLAEGERSCLLFGGETTVTVRGTGKGGRNQELALAFALEIAGQSGVTLLSAGTDGNDGPTDAAGALVDGDTAERARRLGMGPAAFLDDNNAYGFFRQLDALSGGRSHFMTGPTGTNVMDLQIILLEKKPMPNYATVNSDEEAEELARQ